MVSNLKKNNALEQSSDDGQAEKKDAKGIKVPIHILVFILLVMVQA
jgi:hypothetical protein